MGVDLRLELTPETVHLGSARLQILLLLIFRPREEELELTESLLPVLQLPTMETNLVLRIPQQPFQTSPRPEVFLDTERCPAAAEGEMDGWMDG